jgi:gliding motility-associated peptidyl-prolyl isomerase
MKTNFYTIILILLLFACKEPEARKPILRASGSELAKTVAINKKLVADEDRMIENYIHSDSLKYKSTQKGFWYAYIVKNDSLQTPVKGDLVTFEQEIKSLNDSIIYSKEMLGLQQYYVDKEFTIKGIQEGIKLMHVGEEVKFVFSSYVAYRSQGDALKKIGIHEPIVCKLKLINIKK